MELSSEAIRERLRDWPVARLATIGANGRPFQVPIVFAQLGECLWSPIDGKPKSGRELTRVRNIRERPSVSLLLDEYTHDWKQLWWIRIEATGRVVQPDGANEDATFSVAVEALRAKYPQYASVPLLPSPPTLLAFDSLQMHSWCAGSFGT